MIDNNGKILLLDHQDDWAERFVNALQVRGWQVLWTSDADLVFNSDLYSVYLVNLSHPSVDPKEVCDHIRKLPKGENASIFLLNDGQASLKSFEEALSIGADGLYFHLSQMPILLTNFPPKNSGHTASQSRSDRAVEAYQTLSSRHFGAGITLGGMDRDGTLTGQRSARERHESLRVVHNQDRVTHMSLNHMHHQRRSQGYVTNSLSVSDIEAALANVDEQNLMGKLSSSDSLSNISNLSSQVHSPLPKLSDLATEDEPVSAMSNDKTSLGPNNQFPSLKTPLVTPQAMNEPHHVLKSQQTPLVVKRSTPVNLGFAQELNPVPSLPWGQEVKLSEVAFCQILGHIISHRLSLNLLVHEGEQASDIQQWVELSISEGEIVGVLAQDLVLALMKHLIAQGMINQRDAEGILRLASQSTDAQSQMDDFVDAMIEVAPHVIDQLDSVMEQVLIKQIFRLFELTKGNVKTLAYSRPQDIHRFKLSPARLLIDGIRESMGKLRLYKLFGTPKVMPAFDHVSLYLSQLNELERRVIQGAQGHRTVSELAQDSGLALIDTLALCYAFSLLGEASLNDQSPLKRFYQRACSQDYYQLLSLDYSATDEQIQEAWQSHRQWLNEQRGQPELIAPLIEIVNDAYCVLAHPPLRVRYLNSLEKPIYSEMSIMPQAYAPSPRTREPQEI